MKNVVKGLFKLSSLEVFSRQSLGSFTRKMALASSVALLLGGFAAQKSFAAEFFTPKAEHIIREEMKASANNVPFALMAAKDYQLAVMATKLVGPKLQEPDSPEAEKDLPEWARVKNINARNNQLIFRQLASSLVGLKGKADIDPRVSSVLEANALDGMLSAQQQSVSGPMAMPFGQTMDDRAVIVTIYNPSELLEPTVFERSFFENLSGLRGLDKALGSESAQATRAIVVSHEIAHVGQKTPDEKDIPNMMSNYDAFLSFANKVQLGWESDADLTALKALHKATGNENFVENYMYLRAVSTVLLNDYLHATQCDIADYLKRIDPRQSDLPSMSHQRVLKAFEKIWTNEELSVLNKECKIDIDPETGAFSGSMMNLLSKQRHLLEQKIAQGMLVGDANALAKFALKGLAHFEHKIEAAMKAELQAGKTEVPEHATPQRQTGAAPLGI